MDDLLPNLPDVVVEPTAILDIVLTAVLIYGILSLIQGTRAVRLVIGAIILFVVYVMAQELELRLLSGILQAGAVVGLLALVVVFQPELRRGLDRLGRVGSWGWLGPPDVTGYQRSAGILAASAARLSRRRAGALIVIERETGLGDMAETGIPIDAELSTELLTTIFAAGYPLHDGAVIVRGPRIVAAGVMLPLAERDASLEAYGTRHRAALGIAEQTDALVIVVSEERGAISLAEGGSIVRDLDEHELRQRLYGYLGPSRGPGRASADARDARVVADPLEGAASSDADAAPVSATPGGGGREDAAEAKSATGPLS
jgi:diadenylate cyclase